MSDLQEASYRKVVKNTVVLGGSQVVQMIVTLLRTKIIAVLLGPLGMGVNTLILSALSTIQQFSSFGIYQSGVRDLSHVYNTGDAIKIAKLRKIFNILTLISGVLGVVVCFFLSPWLSHFLFGNKNYTLSFVAVAITLLFMALQSGKTTIMQTTQHLNLIAKATIVGAILNLFVTIPMFYFWGMGAIVPTIITGYVVFYLVNRYYEKKIIFADVPTPSRVEFVAYSKPIVKLGAVLMISMLLMVSFTFLLNGFISNMGSVFDVGLFQAASSICMQSLVIVNVTLSSDYYPRLSAVHNNIDQLKTTVNRQAEIMLYIIAPISVLLITFAPFLIRLFLSSQFLSIIPLVQTMSLALIFRVLWMILGLIILAKGDKKNYLIFDAIIGNGSNFVLNICAYYWGGLIGLGISYIVGSVFMVVFLSIVIMKLYQFHFDKKMILNFALFCLLLIITYFSSIYFEGLFYYLSLSFFSIVVVVTSIYQLNKRLNIISFIQNKLNNDIS